MINTQSGASIGQGTGVAFQTFHVPLVWLQFQPIQVTYFLGEAFR